MDLHDHPNYQRCVAFHGHSCPGLAIGYRAALYAIELLGLSFSEDEEVVCVTENDACGVDAIQVLLGCSAGKGNLLFRLRGKSVYTFFERRSGRSVRLSLKTLPEGDREAKTEYLLTARHEDLYTTSPARFELPEAARIFRSITCEVCGESTMESMVRIENGKQVCLDCFHPYSRNL